LELIKQLEGKGESIMGAGGAELLVGTWRLVFTNALDILSLSLLPFVRIGPIYQNVEAGEISGEYNLYNLIDLSPPLDPVLNAFDVFGSTVTRIRVTAKGDVLPSDTRKLNIKFVRSAVEGVSLLGIDLSDLPKLSAQIPSSPNGLVDTIFIDDEMRILRAPPTPNASQDSNYFVLLRE
jgi:PAP_fibrillin